MTSVVDIKSKRPYDVYIGRGGPYGNQFVIGPDGTKEEVVEKFRVWFWSQPEEYRVKVVAELKDKVLGCFCYPLKCHGDVYIDAIENSKRS